MNRTLKTALIVVAVLLVLCSAAGAGLKFLSQQFGQAMIIDPAQVNAKGQEIATYKVPANYSTAGAMKVLERFDAVFYFDPKKDMSIMLMQIPQGTEMNSREMQAQIKEIGSLQTSELEELKRVGSQDITIAGHSVPLNINEGIRASTGEKMRQMAGYFAGKNGPVLIMITGPVKGWDTPGVQSFLNSMK